MKIYIELEYEWTIKDIKDFLSNPHDPRFTVLSSSERDELAICAYMYRKLKDLIKTGDKSFDEAKELTIDDITAGLENHLNKYVEEYIFFYREQLEIYQKDS